MKRSYISINCIYKVNTVAKAEKLPTARITKDHVFMVWFFLHHFPLYIAGSSLIKATYHTTAYSVYVHAHINVVRPRNYLSFFLGGGINIEYSIAAQRQIRSTYEVSPL